MLRPVHMAERKIHHLIENFHGILRSFRKANTENAVNALRMTLIADVMTVHAASFTEFSFMADRTLHFDIFIQIFQRRFADQTFLFHCIFPP